MTDVEDDHDHDEALRRLLALRRRLWRRIRTAPRDMIPECDELAELRKMHAATCQLLRERECSFQQVRP